MFFTTENTGESRLRELLISSTSVFFVLSVVQVLLIEAKIFHTVIHQHGALFVFRHAGEIFSQIFL